MKLIAVIVSLVALAGAGVWYAGTQFSARPSEQAPATQPTVLGVEQFMRNVDRYRGPVSVIGVVSAASADSQIVALIDTKEFAECGLTNCASLTLPVRWAGPMPALHKTVHVAGGVEESDGKLVFVASALQEVAP